jgi:ATP-dependent protease ClpP protease subunit
MKIKIRGVVVPNDDKWIYDWFDMESVCPKDVETQLATANGEDVEVEINSVGGEVYAGSDIYTMLKDYAGKVTVKILGVAASAASVIAMAGDKTVISPTAQIMIHNVWSRVLGDYRDMEHEAVVLKGWNKSIANAYMLKSGMSQSELLALMDKESWLTAQEALQNKLVDEIMFDKELTLAASLKSSLLPPEVINKIRNLLKQETAQGRLNCVDPELASKPDNEPASGSDPDPGLESEPKNEEKRQAPLDLYTQITKNHERRLLANEF